MPHKINPIHFENAEGNAEMTRALCAFLADKLPISRLQRDLSGSTVMRNLGSALGYAQLSLKSLENGLSRLEPNETTMREHLQNAYELLAEPIQMMMRRYGIDDAYDQLKTLTRGQGGLNKESFKLSLLGATKTSCMIAFILAGSSFLALAMGFTGLPRNLAIWIQEMNLSPYVLIFVLTLFYIILGMFLDGISAVVLTMAIIEPMIRQAGFDMIWFGIFLVIVVEMAQITPPVGFNLFVLQGMANRDMGFIAKSAFPLFLLMILAVFIIILFPEISLWLPNQMIQSIK